MFRVLPCSSSGGLRRNCIHAASGIVTVCRWLSCALVKKELRSITLVDFQLDAQNSYLFIYNTFIKILYMFQALPCSSSGGLRHNCIHAVSGIVTVCRWLSCVPVKKELRCMVNQPSTLNSILCIFLPPHYFLPFRPWYLPQHPFSNTLSLNDLPFPWQTKFKTQYILTHMTTALNILN